jgi:hypothetical protein
MAGARAKGAAKRGRLRKYAVRLGITLAVLLVGWLILLQSLSFQAPEEFYSQKGELTVAEVTPLGGDSAYDAYQLTLNSSAGYRVRGYLRAPKERGRWPAVIVIGGTNTGKMAAELFTPERPYVILGLDYPWEGPTRVNWWQFLIRIFAIRRAMLLTPSAVSLGADYLDTRPDVDGDRMVFAGASFGAQLMAVAGALDERAQKVLIIYGGGDYAALLRANLKVKPGWLRSAAADVVAWLIRPIEPLDYVGQIAPRETIIINGRFDDRMPVICVLGLYDVAGEPKRLIWLDEGHISSRNPELIGRVLVAASQALETESTMDEEEETSTK